MYCAKEHILQHNDTSNFCSLEIISLNLKDGAVLKSCSINIHPALRIFWECLKDFLHSLAHLLIVSIPAIFTASKAAWWLTKLKDRVGVLNNCIGYIDGTVVKIARLNRILSTMDIKRSSLSIFEQLLQLVECSTTCTVRLKDGFVTGLYNSSLVLKRNWNKWWL